MFHTLHVSSYCVFPLHADPSMHPRQQQSPKDRKPKTYMPKQQNSARYVKYRRALALSGGAIAIPLMAAVVSERAVWIGHKRRAADALVAQVACSLKRYDNAPAAECN